MGNAFVAVANDATAAFWNPAGLSFLPNTEVTAVVKSLPGITQTTNIGSIDLGVFPGFEDSTTTNSGSIGSSSGEAAFLGVTARIGKDPAKCGTLSISRSLAGFLDRNSTVTQQFLPFDIGDTDTATTDVHDEMRVDYNSIAYGWKPSSAISVGVGVLQAVAKASTFGEYVETYFGESEPYVSLIGPETVRGKGYGALVGALWSPATQGAGKLTLGGSYLTKISLSDFDSLSFGSERPDRLLFGASYRQAIPGSDSGNEVLWSMQLSRSGRANTSDGGELQRNAVWNLYFGGEYDIHRGKLSLPIRYGVFSNRTPNGLVYDSETWITLGLGASHSAADWKAEFALQQGLRTGMSLLSFSGGYAF